MSSVDEALTRESKAVGDVPETMATPAARRRMLATLFAAQGLCSASSIMAFTLMPIIA